MLFGITATALLSVGVYVYAQVQSGPIVEIRTVNVFAEQIEGEGWGNLESINFQNLGEFALYQEFNEINSAYPDLERQRQVQAKAMQKETESNDVVDASVPSSTESVDEVTESTELATSTEVIGMEDETSSSTETNVEAVSLDEDDVVEEAAEEEVEIVSPEEEEVEPEVSASPATTSAFMQEVGGFFTGLLVRASEVFPYAQLTVDTHVTSTPIIDEEDDAGTEITGEPDGAEVATTTFGFGSETVSPDDLIAVEEATTTPVAEDNVESESATTTSTTTADAAAPSEADPVSEDSNSIEEPSVPITEPCVDDCVPYLITLSGFGLPIFEPGTVLSGAQLRLSFAAKRKPTRDQIQSLDITYSVDGRDPRTAVGSIVIDEEASNGLNGGYYLFSLPDVLSAEELNNLKINLRYDEDPSELEGFFVESAWLELFITEEPDPEALQSELLTDNNYYEGILTGDELMLPDGEMITFDNTDENTGETLIIKSDKKDYVGLTKTTTYFNVTNTSNSRDSFSLQTHFPKAVGNVLSLEEWEPNKPKQVVVPEYRPVVYHCEAGWEYSGEEVSGSLEDISKLLADTVSAEEVASTTADIEEGAEVTATTTKLEAAPEETDTEVELDTEPGVMVSTTSDIASSTASLPLVDRVWSFMQATFDLGDSGEAAELATTSDFTLVEAPAVVASTASSSSATEAGTYTCRNTNIVRACDEIEGDNTACRVNNVKVQDHELTRFEQGWEVTEVAEGELPGPGLFGQFRQLIGLAPDKKPIPDNFVAKNHTPNTYTIEAGETKYFKMEIEFPPFTNGEFWIEAIGDSEYGLLDPFWSSQWMYRKPVYVDNTQAATSTEQQFFLEIDSSETDFWSNVNADGSDIRFIKETTGNEATWYSTSWSDRVPITIQSSEIDSDLTNFPVYVDLADLGPDFFANVKSDGGDIRVTEADGVTELPIDLVDIDTGSDSGELHFLASSTLSSSADTTYYIYYGNSDASLYAATDTYGSENVWNSDFIAVYHLEEAAAGRGTADLYQDSTSNDYHGDDQLNSNGKAGQVGQGQEVNAQGDANEYILLPSDIVNSETELTFSYWMLSSEGNNQALINGGANNEYLIFMQSGGTVMNLFPGGAPTVTDVSASPLWRHVTVSRDTVSNEWRIFIDGVEDNDSPSSQSLGTLSIPANCLVIGLEQDSSCLNSGDTSQHLNATIDEMRFQSVVPSAAWVAATFRNQSTSTDFYATSTSEALVSTTFTELDHWVQHFDNTNDEADIWVQLDELAGFSSTTIYLYYGNSGASSASDEYEPFTYSTTTDLYYVVSDLQTSPIVVYSLIDGNEVSIDGGAAVALDSGETTSFATYSSSSVISALGPITARTTDQSSEPPAPIAFATTTLVTPTNRGDEDFYVHAPFGTAVVDVFNGGIIPETASGTVPSGATVQFDVNVSGGSVGLVESDEPVLVFHERATGDSYVSYPPITRDLYGIYSTDYQYATYQGGTSVDIYCSDGNNGTTTGMTRGGEEADDFCNATGNGNGLGPSVRITSSTAPIAAVQEADGDGGESTIFLPTPEFGTRYVLPQDTEYVTVACAPRFGTVNIEVRTSGGSTVDSGTCTPNSSQHPGALNLTPGSAYTQGYQVVSTNDVPFYMYYEHNGTGDETNTWSAVQAKKYNSLYYESSIGAEESNQDAQYEQLNYRWYENLDAITPTTGWDLGDDGNAGEGEPIVDQGSVNTGDVLRLRMNLEANNGTGTVDSTSFELQYAEAPTCSSVVESSWFTVGEIGSTTAAFAGYNNASVSDGATLPSTVLSDSDVEGSYEERNLSVTIPNEVGTDEAIEFDWVLTAANISTNAEYCFRMVRAGGTALATYTLYPELLTAGPPEVPNTVDRFDNEHATSTTPTLVFAAVDLGSDDVEYEVEVATDYDFSSIVIDENSDGSFDFINLNDTGNKSPFNSGDLIEFTPPSALSNGTTYWWRVRASDPNGSNTFGDWTTSQSFTINTALTISEWFQTTDEQFETNSLTSATTSGSGSVELDLGGSSNIGEYGSIEVANNTTTTINYFNTYTDPVVVASIRYSRSVADGDQSVSRIISKGGTSFDVLALDDGFDASGSSTIDYVVMEAGEYLIEDGVNGLRVFATSTSVSSYQGGGGGNPSTDTVTFPSSFGNSPVALASVTTNNDPDWIIASVYSGSSASTPPSATEVKLFLNDSIYSDGHSSAEDVDVIAFDIGDGTNNTTDFDVTTSGSANVTDSPTEIAFSPTFTGTPGMVIVQSLTNNGGDGGYAMVDTDNAVTSATATVAIDEGTTGSRAHGAAEQVGLVAFEAATGTIIRAGNGQMTSTAIDFDDADVGNAWGTFSFNDTGDVTYRLQYQTGSGFQDIPDAVLSGNSAGFTTSPVNILDLDTTTYNEIRIVASLTGVSPEIYDWTITWGLRVETPTLGDPFDNEKTADDTPTFDFTTTDPQGDDLEYEISYSTDPTFTVSSTTINSSSTPADWSNLTTPADTNPFNSGDTITYTVPGGSALTDGETYWWRVRAKDPNGADAWSPWSTADNFTVDATVSVSTWFQTTQEQFQEGELDGVFASTSDSVEISSEIGEYGTTSVTNNGWSTINTTLNYDDMVVIASPRYAFNGTNNGRTVQVRSKSSNSFQIRAENYTESLTGSTDIDYIVMEAGDWNIEADTGTMRVIAGTQEDVAVIEGPSYSAGVAVDFVPDFVMAPAVFTTISSDNNGAKWTGSFVDDGTQAGEVGVAEMHVSLGISLDTDTVRVAEDIDYVAIETGTSSNNGVLFDVFNTPNVITESDAESATTFNQSFTTAPDVIVVQNNANNGADGGFAQVDTDTAVTSTGLDLTIAEIGPTAGNHAVEVVSLIAFETIGSTILRDSITGGGLSGTIASEEVLFSDGTGPKFDRALFAATEPGNSTTSIQIQYQTATGSWALIPDTDLPGNSSGFATSPVDLTGLNVVTYPVIRLLGTLQCDSADCPTLDDWTVEWSEGVPMTGTLREYDRITNVNTATVTVSINGAAPTRIGTVSAGVWTINNVTAFAGDILTVFVSDVPDEEEAVGVFVYDGLGDMTGVHLYERHLTITSDETPSTTLAKLALSDNSVIGDEDVFFDVNGSGDLDVCAVGTCWDANLYVGATNTLVFATSTDEEINAHDFVNFGDTHIEGDTMRLTGSWDNQGTITHGTSEVIMAATSTTETLDDADDILDFYDLTFGETSGTATFQPADPLDLAGSLSVDFGTLDRDGLTINVERDLSTGASGFWTGAGTTTLDGTGSHNWTDANSVKQDVGILIVDGSARTAVVGSDVLASSITIGANDTLNGGGSHTINVVGDFTNNNMFIPQTSRVAVVGTSTTAFITMGGSDFYTFKASTTGSGAISFADATVTLLNDFEIATGTVTMPTTKMNIGGSMTNTGGIFAHNNAEVEFTSGGSETLTLLGDPLYNAFYDVTFTGSGDWTFLDTNATTSNNFTISNGTVTLPSGQLSIHRDFTVSGSGAFDANNGEVLFLVAADDTVTTNGSSFNDVRVRETSPIREGSYDTSWLYRDMITIDATQVDDDLTNFPVFLDLSDFDANFFANLNSDGGDIRITTSDGATEVAREVVTASTTAMTGEVHFLAPALSSTTDTIFYIYYGNSGASDYAITDTYGAENVWDSNYLGVYHLVESSSGSSGEFVDSTDNDNDGTGENTLPTQTTGWMGVGQDMANGHIDLGSGFTDIGTNDAYTVSAWVNLDGTGDYSIVSQWGGGANGYLWWADAADGGTGFCHYTDGTYTPQSVFDNPGNDCRDDNSQTVGSWQHVAIRYDNDTANSYSNGTTTGLETTGLAYSQGTVPFSIGSEQGNNNTRALNGQIDEVRISSIDRGDAWVLAEYRNQATTTDFYTVVSGSSTSTRIFSGGTVTADGDVTIESGTAQFPTVNFNIAGSFDNDGVFIAGNGAVTFNATTSGHSVAAGTSTFYDLTFNGQGGGWNVTEHATATNAITLTNGDLLTVNSGIVLESTGTFSNAMDNASTTWTGSTLKLTSGTDYDINLKTHGGDDYATLLLTGDTDIGMWNSTASTYTTQASSSIYSMDHAGTDGDLYIFGDYERDSGTEYWATNTDFDGVALSGSTTRQVDVRVANGSVIRASSSTFLITGTSTASTTVDSQSGSFTFLTNLATVTAQYFEMTGTDAAGLQLLGSTTVTLLDDALFTIAGGSAAISVDASTIDTNPAAQFFDTNFITGGGSVNVDLLSVPTSFWWFRDGQGDRYGEAFDNGDGDPGSVRWDDSNFQINIDGVVYADDGAVALGGPTCNGATNVVRVVVDDGAYTDIVPCSGLDGSFSFTNVSYGGDPTIVVYLDGALGGEQGSVITRTPTANITDLNVYVDRVMTRHEDTTPMAIAKMAEGYDENDDPDLNFVAATGTPDTLTVRPETELIIASSTTFVPGGNITLESGGSGNDYDGSFHIDNDATFTASSSESHSVGGSFYADDGATFTVASSTFDFTATTSGKTITASSTLTFDDVNFTGVGGGWNINTDLLILGNMAVATGTVTGTGDITIENGSMTGNGLVSMGGGTVTIEETSTLGGTQGWTFNNLTLGNGTEVGTTTPASNATTTVLSTLTISAAHFLDAGSSYWDLAGNGTVFVETGTFLEDTSRVTYSGTAAVNILSTDYYDLAIAGTAGTPTFTFGATGLNVLNDLIVAGAVSSTATLNTNDPVLQVDGDVLIGVNGVLVGSDSTALTVLGSWDNSGTFTSSGGEVAFTSTDPFTIAAGASSFGDVTISGAGAATVTENATSTGAWTLAAASNFTVDPGVTMAVGGVFTNGAGGAATTWTDSTLFLYGGDYEANASTTSDVYGTLHIGPAAEVRIWNSSAATTTVNSAGSLYSMDHANVDGDLYIFGTYTNESRNDYWSYATDFDGTPLSGGSTRQVDVYIASSSEVVYSGGSLAVLGSTTASTTLQNQGVGSYALTATGTASVNWRYVILRGLDADGVTFGGSPTVVDFSDTDHLAEIENGTMITVGGDAINANPGKNFNNNVFNLAGPVTNADNVTLFGSTGSGWRYTGHTGNRDGESFDVDSGDPGEIIWDDSNPIFSISGTVYQSDRTSTSTVCDGVTNNILLAIDGSVAQNASTSCSAIDGTYSISNISFDSNDVLTIFINGETQEGVTVSVDSVGSLANFDIYEDHVIARNAGSNPLTIADMDFYDRGDDGDIPFTANTSPDTLTLESDTTLLVWTGKEFEPGGDITTGGGAGNTLDGTVELLNNATLTLGNGEDHSFGGNLTMGTGSTFTPAQSTTTFTSNGTGRTIDTNENGFYNIIMSGSADFTFTDTALNVASDMTLSASDVTLPAGTTTISGSLTTTGGSFDANGGVMVFDSSDSGETITANGSDFNELYFDGTGTWAMNDTNATTTALFTVATGTVTLPSGILAVGADFINDDTLVHNSGEVKLTSTSGNIDVTLSGSDLYTLTIAGGATTTMTDASAALLGDLTVASGTLNVATNTLSIGGSLDATGGVMNTASGTILFNSSDTGETIDPGANLFYNAVIGGPSGGWTLANATTSNNFSITGATSFAMVANNSLEVRGVFLNSVGGTATDWNNSTLYLNGQSDYTINTKLAGGDEYDTLIIGDQSHIRSWDSAATTTIVNATSSLYSQDHDGSAGALNIYGDFRIATSTEYWSYATDFDGAALGGSSRAVTVSIASGATTTVEANGTLEIIGVATASTTIQNQGSGSYVFDVSGGTVNFSYYQFNNLNSTGVNFSGTPTITSLTNGDYILSINGGSLITLATSTLNANPSLLILNTGFSTTSPASFGTNVNLAATTTNAWTFRGHFGGISGEVYDQDGLTNCGSIRWDDSSCLLTEQTSYRWRFDDGNLEAPASEWYDSNWDKRQRVRFVNGDNQAYTNAVYEITVNYDADMQSDFDDLRFTDSDGMTEIDFWIEDFTINTEAKIWVEVPSVAANDTAHVFMYYGNSTATTTSSSTATFVVIDDFEDNNITEYSGQTGDFQTGTTFVYGGTYSLEAQSSFSDGGMARFDQASTSQGQIIRYRQYIDNPSGSSDELCTMFGVQSPVSNNENYAVCLELFGTERVSLVEDVVRNDGWLGVTVLASSTANFTGAGTGWYEVEIDWQTDNTIDVYVYDPNDALLATTSATDSTYTEGGYGYTYWTNNGSLDSFHTRARVETEPTVIFGVEQGDGGADWAADLNTGAIGFETNDVARLRIAVENTGLDITDQEILLEYASKGASPTCEAVPGASFSTVQPQGTCGVEDICMATSSNAADNDATVDLLEIDQNTFTAGEFIEDPSNKTSQIDIDQNEYTEIEYAITITPNASQQAYCFRVTDDGTEYDAYQFVPELTVAFPPVLGTISFNLGQNISLVGGTTTRVYATTTVTDINGFADLENSTSTMYTTSATAACTADPNSCYIENSSSTCSYTGCAGNSCTLECYADFIYHTTPTDTNGGEFWYAFLEVRDSAGYTDFGTSPAVDVNTLNALEVDETIDYGALAVNSTTTAFSNPSTTVENIGNSPIDIDVEGSDLSDGSSSVIPATQQRFATSSFDYDTCTDCTILTTTTISNYELDLLKPTTTSPTVEDEIFWGIVIPFGTASQPHSGVNTFYAVTD